MYNHLTNCICPILRGQEFFFPPFHGMRARIEMLGEGGRGRKPGKGKSICRSLYCCVPRGEPTCRFALGSRGDIVVVGLYATIFFLLLFCGQRIHRSFFSVKLIVVWTEFVDVLGLELVRDMATYDQIRNISFFLFSNLKKKKSPVVDRHCSRILLVLPCCWGRGLVGGLEQRPTYVCM